MNKLSFWERMLGLKLELKLQKGTYNQYGKFFYRTKEQILEALKPLEKEFNIFISTNHRVVEIAGRLFVEAVAEAVDIEDGVVKFTRTSLAEMQPVKSTQMNESQLTGSAESYAGKRALESMLGLDNSKDADDEQLTKIETEKPLRTISVAPTIEPIDEEQERRQKLYQIGQATLKANSLKDITDLLNQVKELGGDEKYEKIIGQRALNIGLKQSIKGEWSE